MVRIDKAEDIFDLPDGEYEIPRQIGLSGACYFHVHQKGINLGCYPGDGTLCLLEEDLQEDRKGIDLVERMIPFPVDIDQLPYEVVGNRNTNLERGN